MAVALGLQFGDYGFNGDEGPPFLIGAVRSNLFPEPELIKYFLDPGGNLCSIQTDIIQKHKCSYTDDLETKVGSGALLVNRKAYSDLDIIIPVSSTKLSWQHNSFPSPESWLRSYKKRSIVDADLFLESKYANTSIIGSELLYHWGLQVHLDYNKKLFIIQSRRIK